MVQRKESDNIRCPLEYGLKIPGSRWNARIICVLSAKEVLRYSELRKQIGNITDAVLAELPTPKNVPFPSLKFR